MPAVLMPVIIPGGFAKAGANTSYINVGDSGDPNSATAEADVNITWRTAGTFNNLYQNVSANTTTAATSATFRVNGTSVNEVISIGSASTGSFQDTSHTDVVAAGAKVDIIYVVPSGTVTRQATSIVFTPTAAVSVQKLVSMGVFDAGFSAASATLYDAPAGALTAAVITEANAAWKSETVGTLTNLFTNVISNARVTATTINSRVSAANGSLTVSIGSASTGIFEDTTHSDVYAVGSTFDYVVVTGTGTTVLDLSTIATEFYSGATNSSVPLIASVASIAVASNITEYMCVGGMLGISATEGNTQTYALTTFTASSMQAHVSANGITAASTLRFRNGGVNGNQVISIGSASTGLFEDNIDVDIVTSTSSTVNLSIASGATGTTITFNFAGCWMIQAITSAFHVSFLPLLGAG